MNEHQSSRTLLKSAPELWAECSDAASLARHLGAFGEIRITKLEPETAVAWEGAAASGTVRLESSGWGTRVILTVSGGAAAARAPAPVPVAAANLEPATEPKPATGAEPAAEPAEPEPAAEPQPEPTADSRATEPRRPGMLARMMLAFRRKPTVAEPEREPEPVMPPPAPHMANAAAPDPPSADDALAAALDSLGGAHHRPYSRA
ncbi:MAG: hypothetical protein ACJ780_11195 [Solirubrobacteraceae bacterium]